MEVEVEGETESVVVVIPVAVVMVGLEGGPVPGEEADLERAVVVARCMNFMVSSREDMAFGSARASLALGCPSAGLTVDMMAVRCRSPMP